MINNPPPPVRSKARRLGCLATRAGAVGSAVMLAISIAGLVGSGADVLAQTSAGAAVVVSGQISTSGQPLTSGGSATVFSLQLPVGAACTGDSASSDYRIQSYMVPAAVDPATLTYGIQGPLPLGTGASYRQPLFRTPGGERYVNVLTGVAVQAGGPGPIPTLPNFDFTAAPFASGIVAPGDYNVGVACTRAGGTVLDKYWNAVMTFAADAADTPSGLTWTVPEQATTTTTTTTVAGGSTTTTTTVAGATTTTTVAAGSTNATVTPASPTPGGAYSVTFPNCQVGETITFSQSASTPASVTDVCEASSALTSGSVVGLRMPTQATTGTATGSFTAAPRAVGTYTVTMTGTVSAQRTASFVIAGAATPVTGGGSSSSSGGTSGGSSSGTIPSTGSSTTSLIVWGVLLLVFGRTAILLGRKPKVLTGT